MQKEEGNLLEVLKSELEFLADGDRVQITKIIARAAGDTIYFRRLVAG